MEKNRIKLLIIVFSGIFFYSIQPLMAQSSSDLKINELLVYNDSNFVDDFGQHSPWIEIFNSAYNTVDIGGLYLTNDLNNPTKYRIAKGQPITRIPPRSYLVFWADSVESRGIRHLNFNLEYSEFIALFDANGRTLIDSVSLPVKHIHNITYGRLEDGDLSFGFLERSTPNASNSTTAKVTGAEQFGKLDPTGVAMITIAMSVVFSALAFLFFFFKNMGRVLNWDRKKYRKEKGLSAQTDLEEEISGEINAAIALALFLYRNELHDHENTILTINKVSKTYSPWSSKIYGLRQNPK